MSHERPTKTRERTVSRAGGPSSRDRLNCNPTHTINLVKMADSPNSGRSLLTDEDTILPWHTNKHDPIDLVQVPFERLDHPNTQKHHQKTSNDEDTPSRPTSLSRCCSPRCRRSLWPAKRGIDSVPNFLSTVSSLTTPPT